MDHWHFNASQVSIEKVWIGLTDFIILFDFLMVAQYVTEEREFQEDGSSRQQEGSPASSKEIAMDEDESPRVSDASPEEDDTANITEEENFQELEGLQNKRVQFEKQLMGGREKFRREQKAFSLFAKRKREQADEQGGTFADRPFTLNDMFLRAELPYLKVGDGFWSLKKRHHSGCVTKVYTNWFPRGHELIVYEGICRAYLWVKSIRCESVGFRGKMGNTRGGRQLTSIAHENVAKCSLIF